MMGFRMVMEELKKNGWLNYANPPQGKCWMKRGKYGNNFFTTEEANNLLELDTPETRYLEI